MNAPTQAHVDREGRKCSVLSPQSSVLNGFPYWCATYCQIEDKAVHSPIPFELYPCQQEVAAALLAGEWLAILKARRLGMTWLLAAYSVWLVTFHRERTIAVLCQDDEYAQDFLDKCRYILDRLPPWMRRTVTRDNAGRMEWNHNGWGGSIRSFAPTRRALHSIAADLVLVDEAARVPWLAEILRAAEPTLETGKGQLVMLTTSDGPLGEYAARWKAARRCGAGSLPAQEVQAGRPHHNNSRLRALFYGWDSHPRRDQGWYDAESAAHPEDLLHMKRNYPRTPEEAFEAAHGRVYALFVETPKFVRAIQTHEAWPRYRALDWGGVDPFVCLWLCEVPGDPPGLTVAPACPHTIEELLAYSYDRHGVPEDRNNHCPDALRYAVTTLGLRGHVHVYRELYVPDSAAHGLALTDLARRVRGMTGAEGVRRTVADRSRPDSITQFCQCDVPTIAARALRGGQAGEIEQGIERVRALLASTARGPDAAPLRVRREPGIPTRIALDGSPLRHRPLARRMG